MESYRKLKWPYLNECLLLYPLSRSRRIRLQNWLSWPEWLERLLLEQRTRVFRQETNPGGQFQDLQVTSRWNWRFDKITFRGQDWWTWWRSCVPWPVREGDEKAFLPNTAGLNTRADLKLKYVLFLHIKKNKNINSVTIINKSVQMERFFSFVFTRKSLLNCMYLFIILASPLYVMNLVNQIDSHLQKAIGVTSETLFLLLKLDNAWPECSISGSHYPKNYSIIRFDQITFKSKKNITEGQPWSWDRCSLILTVLVKYSVPCFTDPV